MIRFLEGYLNKNQTMLETGSGRSTVWFAERVKQIESVEHHKGWFDKVSADFEKLATNNINYFHAQDNDENPENSDYVQKVASYPDNFFDIILIDGIYRGEIAKVGYDKLKSGGVFLIDNVERYLIIDTIAPERITSKSEMTPEWIEFDEKTKHFKKEVFSDNVTATMVVYKS